MVQKKFDKKKLESLKNGPVDVIVDQRQFDVVPSLDMVRPLVEIYGGEVVRDFESDNRIPEDKEDLTIEPVEGNLAVVIFQGRDQAGDEGTFDRQVVNQLPSIKLFNGGKEGHYRVPVRV